MLRPNWSSSWERPYLMMSESRLLWSLRMCSCRRIMISNLYRSLLCQKQSSLFVAVESWSTEKFDQSFPQPNQPRVCRRHLSLNFSFFSFSPIGNIIFTIGHTNNNLMAWIWEVKFSNVSITQNEIITLASNPNHTRVYVLVLDNMLPNLSYNLTAHAWISAHEQWWWYGELTMNKPAQHLSVVGQPVEWALNLLLVVVTHNDEYCNQSDSGNTVATSNCALCDMYWYLTWSDE